ncbi:MAG: hypothetical protein JO020_23780 [Chloroflexi bacterium]|nr:hypothetical protein [Chloroflexota bacterium]
MPAPLMPTRCSQTAASVVAFVTVDALGGIRVELTGQLSIKVALDDSPADEYWRLFEPARDRRHLVVGSGGVDHVPDDGADLDPSLSFNR